LSIFHDEDPLSQDPRRRSDPTTSRPPLRQRIGRWALAAAAVIALVFALLPSPYVIEKPGPVFDTLGTFDREGEEVPLIEIPDETTYPTDGTLDLLTVSAVGRPGATPGWLDVIAAWFDPSRAALPLEAVFPPGQSEDDRNATNEAQMVDSQQDAIAAALVELGYDFPRDVVVAGLAEESPSEGVLQEGDIITALDGTEVHAVQELRDAVREHGTASPAAVTVLRDGQALELEVTPVEVGDTVVLGIGVRMEYDFPVDVTIQLDDVGGPSAGMMFALGIVDKLTPDAMTGGERVAGTGTIDSAGNVGAIGGIRQKLFGARDAGADWFLAPESNCDDVAGNVPDGITVFAVSTLDDAREVVETIGDGGDTSDFATCESG
jgi:PDZ domain-containing protein